MGQRWRTRTRPEANVRNLYGPATAYPNRSGAFLAPRRHQRDHPGWGCTVCGREWPCAPGRVQLVDEFVGSPISLATYMAGQLGDAARDMPHASAEDLFQRFVAWTQR